MVYFVSTALFDFSLSSLVLRAEVLKDYSTSCMSRKLMAERAFVYTIILHLATCATSSDSTATTQGNFSTQDVNPKQGWTPQPDGRGTLDILWNCILTMFLCSWSILCLNIPAPKETKQLILWRKFAMTGLGFLCPELVFEIALGQWLSARQSVRDFNSASSECRQPEGQSKGFGSVKTTFRNRMRRRSSCAREGWTMEAAFFADMGGFILHTRDQNQFPLDAEQLQYLVSKGFLDQPTFSNRELEEKNKVDSLLRTITLCQIIWFVVNTIARWVQRLVVTTAELTTMSFILCSLGTAFLWWNKPADAVAGRIIYSDISINDILRSEGQPVDAWKRTPLDFVNRKEWWWSRCWANFVNILTHMHITFGTDKIPIDRIADSLQKELPCGCLLLCLGLTVGYFAVLFAGWNYTFPSNTEQLLWRGACLTLMASLFALAMVAPLVHYIPALQHKPREGPNSGCDYIRSLEDGLPMRILARSRHIYQRIDRALDCIRNNSIGKDPYLYNPLRLMIPIYIIGTFYCLARIYILVADILELRSLPTSAYTTVDWLKLIPHLN